MYIYGKTKTHIGNMKITEYLHKINTPITLLKVYFSILEEKETSSESDFTEKHLSACINAVKEIEQLIEQMEKELDGQN